MDLNPLKEKLGDRFRPNEALSKHTSFKIGGPAEAFCRVETAEELKFCLDLAQEGGLPVFFLAGGTNLLVRDGGLPGLTLQLSGEFKEIRVDGRRIRVGAGANLAKLSRSALQAGLAGLEFGIGIPGSVGGAVIMNAGAHGQELKDVCRRVGVFEDGEIRRVDAADCGFAYRSSRFKGGKSIVLWADLELIPGDGLQIETRMNEVLGRRRDSQPLSMPNAGCVFKNPEGESAGRLIEAAGLKGLRRGGAEISEVHANFVVNKGGARAEDVLWLMNKARAVIKEKNGIDLVDEILVVGVDL